MATKLLLILGAVIVILSLTTAWVVNEQRKFEPVRRKLNKVEASIGASKTTIRNIMGQPDRRYLNPHKFNEMQKGLAKEGLLAYDKYIAAEGEVWLYRISTHRYLTVFFSKSGKVSNVTYTWWEYEPTAYLED